MVLHHVLLIQFGIACLWSGSVIDCDEMKGSAGMKSKRCFHICSFYIHLVFEMQMLAAG